MPRRGNVPKRIPQPDPKYRSDLVGKFINVLMLDGAKSVAEQIVYGALEQVERTTGEDPVHIFVQALQNVKPRLEVRSRRVGGATYQVPMEVRPERSQALAMRWLVQYARARTERGMDRKLAAELLDAYNKRGSSIKKREDTHRMAEANRAFAHYRW